MGGSGKLCNKFGEKLSLIEKIAMDVLIILLSEKCKSL